MANAKEAQARIKINKLLETAGWRFFDDARAENQGGGMMAAIRRRT